MAAPLSSRSTLNVLHMCFSVRSERKLYDCLVVHSQTAKAFVYTHFVMFDLCLMLASSFLFARSERKLYGRLVMPACHRQR